MELLRFTINAGETKRFERAGRYLEIITSAEALNLFLSDATGARVDYAINALSGLFMEGAYSSIEVFSATAQTVELLVTEGRGGSRRQPGVVQVVDGARERSRNAEAFGFYQPGGSGGGLFSAAAVYNKSANPRTLLVIERLWVASDTAGQVLVYGGGAPPAAVGNAPRTKSGTVAASANAETRTGTLAALPANVMLCGVLLAANQSFALDLKSPIIVPPGGVLMACSVVAGAVVYVGGEHYEWTP